MSRASIINKRIASAMLKRRLDVDDQSDSLLKKIDQQFSLVEKNIFDAAISDKVDVQKVFDFQQSMTRGLQNTQIVISQELKKNAQLFHDWAVWVWTESVPEEWLLARVPAEVIADYESYIEAQRSFQYLNFDAGQIEISRWPQQITENYQVSVPLPVHGMEVAQGLLGVPLKLRKRKLTAADKRDIFTKLIFPAPSVEEVEAIVDESTWAPRLQKWSRLITNNRSAFVQITQGFSDGESIAKIRKRIMPLVNGVRSAAQRVARTETSRIAEQLQRRSWGGLGDLMTGSQVLAVLDENTRPHHASRNGRVYYYAPPPGKPSMAELPDLPDEPNCRCMASPVLKPPKSLEGVDSVGEEIPAQVDPVSAEKWFEVADSAKRKKVVGAERYRFVQGVFQQDRLPEYSDFLNTKGELMPLADLKKETAIERAARKQAVQKMIAEQERDFLAISSRGFLP